MRASGGFHFPVPLSNYAGGLITSSCTAFVNQRIVRKASQLREPGLSDRVIGYRLGITDKTAPKVIRWLGTREPPR